MIKKHSCFHFAVSLMASLLIVGPARAEDWIAIRKDNFHALSDRMRDIVKGLGDGLPVSAMRQNAMAAQSALHRIPDLFPEGSGDGKTNALPAIWSDPAGFDQAYLAASARMDALVAAAQGEDRDAFGAAAGRMAAACGNCHATFRATMPP